ncbi:PHF5-domain-containing protein, partial [Trematosphaeria pertusa]
MIGLSHDSPPALVTYICDECSLGNYQNKRLVCGGKGIFDAFHCFECNWLKKDRDRCPKMINLRSS